MEVSAVCLDLRRDLAQAGVWTDLTERVRRLVELRPVFETGAHVLHEDSGLGVI